MTAYAPPIYVYQLHKLPGVVAANNFLSVLNPANSGVAHISLAAKVESYASANTVVTDNLLASRSTAHSGGTLIAASTIARFRTDLPNPATTVRIDNPTVTASGLTLGAFAPVIATGTGQSNQLQAPPAAASFISFPGEGIVFSTAAGDTDQIWNIQYIWMEVSA